MATKADLVVHQRVADEDDLIRSEAVGAENKLDLLALGCWM